jgi:hypothetical protein
MTIPLTIGLVIFLGGFVLHRHATVRIAVVAAFALGALLAPDALVHGVVHTLDGVFRSLQ